MEADSLLGVWTGTVYHSNDWDMKMTLSILQPVAIGSMLGVFDIPLLPCSGTFRVVSIREESLELRADRLQGECQEADVSTLEWLPDGTLMYVSKGNGGEIRGVLQRAS